MKVTLRDRLMLLAQAERQDVVDHLVGHVRIREAAFDEGPIAQIVVDRNGFLLLANERARLLFQVAPKELGLPVEQLRQPIRVALSGETDGAQLTLLAINRRGRTIDCRVSCAPLFGAL